MSILTVSIGYLVSLPLSWIMFRTAINIGGRPETHPQKLLMVMTFIPLMNILVSFFGLIGCACLNSKIEIDFFKTKK